MKKTGRRIGLVLGAAMMMATPGTALAAKTETKKIEAEASKTKETAGDLAKEEKKQTEQVYYGKISKVGEGKVQLELAEVIWEKPEEDSSMAAADNKEKPGKKTKQDGKASDKKDTEKKSEKKAVAEKKAENADYESEQMQWKLNGKEIGIVIDQDTILVKEVSEEPSLAEPTADQKTKDEKADAQKTKDVKANDQKEDKKDAQTEEKTGNKKEEPIKLKEIAAGSLVRITLKDEKKLIAKEVRVLNDMTEVKADAADKKVDTADKKADAADKKADVADKKVDTADKKVDQK